MHWACLLQTLLSSEEAQSSLLKCLAQWMTTARPSRKVTLDQVALGALQAGWRHAGWIQKNRSTESSSNCWTTQCWATKMVVVFKLPSLGVVSSVQLLSRVWFFAIPWIAARQASLSVINSQSLLKLMSIESVMPSNHLILCHPLILLLPIPPSIRVFSNESTLHMRQPKYWSFSFSISPSNEHPGLISFRMDWLDLLAVQGTLKSLPQHHSSKA